MAKDHNTYKYRFSEQLQQEIAIAIDGSKIICSDGVTYTRREVKLLKKAGKIDPVVHTVKKIFKGSEILNIKKSLRKKKAHSLHLKNWKQIPQSEPFHLIKFSAL